MSLFISRNTVFFRVWKRSFSNNKQLQPLKQGHEQHYDRNFITALRAMRDFLLSPEELKGLRVTSRRSPNESDPPLTVYWRKDVAAKAVQKWGSLENVDREIEKRERKKNPSSLSSSYSSSTYSFFSFKRNSTPPRALRRGLAVNTNGLTGQSGRVVLTAIGINSTNFILKAAACLFTGSHALFSEAIHSLADTCNQVILAYGIQKSTEKPTVGHPYGYSNMQYVAALISGTGIFCLGAGLSVYHGIHGLINPTSLESLTIAAAVLGASFISESVTLVLAVRSIRKSAMDVDMGFLEYVAGGYDPSVNVVLLEDVAAVLGVTVAAGSMALSAHTGSHIPDAIGSIFIGGLLGVVASFMIYTNANALVGRSIPDDKLSVINKLLEGDLMVRQVHDVKGIDMGNGIVRYKAELDIDGRELTKLYLKRQNLTKLLAEVETLKTPEEFEVFMLKHGENIVDCLGEQVDRIERKIRSEHPEVRHMDLEVL